MLAASTASGTRLWLLTRSAVSGKGRGKEDGGIDKNLEATKVALPALCSGFAHALAFTPDSRRLVICGASGTVFFADIKLRGSGSRGRTSTGSRDAKSRAGVKRKTKARARGKGRKSFSGEDDDDDDCDDDENDEDKIDSDDDDGVDDNDGKDAEDRADADSPPLADVTFGGSIDHRAVVCDTRFVAGSQKISSDSSGTGFDAAGQNLGPLTERVALGLEAAIADVAVSRDGAYLALYDGLRRVYVYEADSLRLYWRLPICPAPIAAVAFHPHAQPPQLVVLLASHGFLVFDLGKLAVIYPSTSSAQPPQQRLPGALSSAAVHGPLQGIAFDPTPGVSRMLLHSQGACVFVDLAHELPTRARVVQPVVAGRAQIQAVQVQGHREKKKAKRDAEGEGPGLALVSDYRSLLHVGYLAGHQLVSVLSNFTLQESFNCFFSSSYIGTH